MDNGSAGVFLEKANLSDEELNEYSTVTGQVGAAQRSFLCLRVRTVRRLLRKIDATSSTGPDLLPARLLSELSAVLALPVALLSQQWVAETQWPNYWRQHWVHPMQKRKSKAHCIRKELAHRSGLS